MLKKNIFSEAIGGGARPPAPPPLRTPLSRRLQRARRQRRPAQQSSRRPVGVCLSGRQTNWRQMSGRQSNWATHFGQLGDNIGIWKNA